MKQNEINRAIHCSVEDCRYHCGSENYCSLDSIHVAAHEQNPSDEKCVDCKSFACKHGGMC